MMKKKRLHTVIICVIAVLSISIYCLFFNGGVNYPQEFGVVFGSYDINLVDEYLGCNTLITYKGNTKTYDELRKNVIKAFEEKKFDMGEYSSYGDTDLFSGVAYIESFPNYNGMSVETYIEMQLESKGLNTVVQSMTSDSEFFGYLFFGNE